MATVAIPLALTAISALAPYAGPIAMFVEGLFGRGKGDAKMQTGTQLLQVAAGALAAQGKIPELPTPERIVGLLQSVVDGLKEKGLLNGNLVTTPTLADSTPAMASISTGKGYEIPISFSGKLTISV